MIDKAKTMRLTLQSELKDNVAVIRCQGRIVAGEEVDALQAEFDKQTKIFGTSTLLVKRVVLDLSETDFIDSSGLGTMVRLFGVLRAADGDLKLCALSPFVQRVLEITNLLSFLQTYPTESEALASFAGPRSAPPSAKAGTGVLCLDNSADILAYVSAILKRSGYEVFTTRNPGEVSTLMIAANPRVVVCGPGVPNMPIAVEVIARLRKNPKIGILQLPPDFSTSDAGDAGVDLVNSVKSLLG